MEVKAGNSKVKQLKELAIYINYSRDGYKFIINEIYKNPTITVDDLTGKKNSKYIKLLSNVIIEYLYKNPIELEQIPLLKLLTLLGVTSMNYQSSNYYKKELSQLYDIQLASIYYFYSNTRREYKGIIERCLNNLQNRRVLNWNRCVIVIDKKNKTTYKADAETQKYIINMEKEALQSLKIGNMFELMKDKKKLKEFNSILKKEMGFQYYYAYDLIIGDIALKIEYENVQIEKHKLNKLIIDKTTHIFEKDYYTYYKNDYKILIDLLINFDNDNKELKQLLEEQHTENLYHYVTGAIIADQEHEHKLIDLRDEYLDKFDTE